MVLRSEEVSSEPPTVAHTSEHSEVEAGGSTCVRGQLGLQSKFKDSQSYRVTEFLRSRLKKKMTFSLFTLGPPLCYSLLCNLIFSL